jgi:hypothetical protein
MQKPLSFYITGLRVKKLSSTMHFFFILGSSNHPGKLILCSSFLHPRSSPHAQVTAPPLHFSFRVHGNTTSACHMKVKKSKQVHATVRPEREDREKHGQRTSAGGDVLLRRG